MSDSAADNERQPVSPSASGRREVSPSPADPPPVGQPAKAAAPGRPASSSSPSSSVVAPPQSTGKNEDVVSRTVPLPRITDLKDRQLGDFRLLRRIGQGGMAEVYLAEQTSLKRQVAVKVLREDMLGDDIHLKRFEQEAKAAGGLNHPNIVQVYTIGYAEGIHFIAQEYVQGMNLREYLTRNGPPDLKTALRFMRQIAAALEAAAEAGVVHRDIKPENILITRKGDVKITDFGLAQLTLPGERLNLTQVGMTMGTPLYMSPEQVNGRNIDHRSDIYSLGVTCYHLLCGTTPFRGETAISVAVQHVNAEPPPLREQRPDLPDVVCRLVHKMMAKQPEDRYQTAEALRADLERIETALQENPSALSKLRLSAASLPGGLPWWQIPFTEWSLRRHLTVFAVCALVVGVAAAGWGWWSRPVSPFDTPPKKASASIPRFSTARQQLAHAFLIDNEDGWKAVIDNFRDPKDRWYRRRAREELASLYIRSRRYDEAETIYRSFIVEDDKDRSLQATGYAGLMVIASLKGRYEESNQIFANQLLPLMRDGKLDRDDELYDLVRKAVAYNNRQLKNRKARIDFDSLLPDRS